MKQLSTGVRTYQIGRRIEVMNLIDFREMQIRELRRKRPFLVMVKDWFNGYTYEL